MVHPEEGLILSSDRVAAAHAAGGINQTRQILIHHTGTARKHGQTLVSAIVANSQAGASEVAFHLTVPPRYLELGMLRRHVDMVARHRRTNAILPFNISVPRGTILLPRTLRLRLRLEPRRQCGGSLDTGH